MGGAVAEWHKSSLTQNGSQRNKSSFMWPMLGISTWVAVHGVGILVVHLVSPKSLLEQKRVIKTKFPWPPKE